MTGKEWFDCIAMTTGLQQNIYQSWKMKTAPDWDEIVGALAGGQNLR